MADETKAAPKAAEQDKTARPATATKADPKGADLDRQRALGVSTGGTTEAQQDEYGTLGVNPALDNRTGDQRPYVAEYPAKPQQIPGPEVGHFAEHAEKHRALADKFARKDDALGMRSPGRHGLGDKGLDEDKLDNESN